MNDSPDPSKPSEGFIFEKPEYATQFPQLRGLPDELMSEYLDILEIFCRSPSRIADLGAGTGQFTLALARRFPSALVHAIEPAAAMIDEAERALNEAELSNVILSMTRLEQISQAERFDLILLSECIHLFDDPISLVDHLARRLEPGGSVAIRTSSQTQLQARDWYRFFPRGLLIDMRRHPPLELVEEALRFHGLSVSRTVVDESRSVPAADFHRLFSGRSFSTLHLLDEDEIQAGLSAIEAEIGESAHCHYDYRMTLMIGRLRHGA